MFEIQKSAHTRNGKSQSSAQPALKNVIDANAAQAEADGFLASRSGRGAT